MGFAVIQSINCDGPALHDGTEFHHCPACCVHAAARCPGIVDVVVEIKWDSDPHRCPVGGMDSAGKHTGSKHGEDET